MRGGKVFFWAAEPLVLLALLLLLASPVDAISALYDEWHHSGDTFIKDGETYLVTHYRIDDESVVLKVNTNSYVIKEGDCKSSMTREYCVASIDREIDTDSEDSHVKYISGTAYAGINIVIYPLGPDISISREFTDTTPEPNQEVKASVTIENEREFSADNFIYTETFPDNVKVTDYSSGFSLAGNTLTYQSSVFQVLSKVSLTYTFIIKDYVSFTSKGVGRYEYAGSMASANSSATTFSLNKPYSLTFSVSPLSVETGEDTALSVRVENEESGSINVSLLELKITSPVRVSSLPAGLSKVGEAYRWNGTIITDGFKQITMLLATTKDGDYPIALRLFLNDSNGKNFSENKTLILKATYEAIDSIVSVKEKTVTEGESYRIALSFNNPNKKKVIMRNIKGNITSYLFGQMPFSLEELGPGQTKTVLVNDSLPVPFVDEKKVYDIIFSGSYDLNFGKSLNFSEKATLTVTPTNETLSIVQSSDKKSVEAGSNVTLTVKIKSNTQESFIVESKDTIPADAVLLGGATDARLSFAKSEEKQAYIYDLMVPESHGEGTITITTTASIPSRGYSLVRSFNITVTPPAGKETNVTASPEEAPVEETPTAEPEKKEGFFTKVINAVSDFFTRLLGKKK